MRLPPFPMDNNDPDSQTFFLLLYILSFLQGLMAVQNLLLYKEPPSAHPDMPVHSHLPGENLTLHMLPLYFCSLALRRTEDLFLSSTYFLPCYYLPALQMNQSPYPDSPSGSVELHNFRSYTLRIHLLQMPYTPRCNHMQTGHPVHMEAAPAYVLPLLYIPSKMLSFRGSPVHTHLRVQDLPQPHSTVQDKSMYL